MHFGYVKSQVEVSFYRQEVGGAGRKDTKSTSSERAEGSREAEGGGAALDERGRCRETAFVGGAGTSLGGRLSPLCTDLSPLHSRVVVLGLAGASRGSFRLAPSARLLGTPPQLARLCHNRPISAGATPPPASLHPCLGGAASFLKEVIVVHAGRIMSGGRESKMPSAWDPKK